MSEAIDIVCQMMYVSWPGEEGHETAKSGGVC